jgi:hypothetical protein
MEISTVCVWGWSFRTRFQLSSACLLPTPARSLLQSYVLS